MDTLASVIMLLVGGALVLASLSSAFRTVVMPRAAFDPVTRAIFLGFRSFMVVETSGNCASKNREHQRNGSVSGHLEMPPLRTQEV